jgi:hypothetical protein
LISCPYINLSAERDITLIALPSFMVSGELISRASKYQCEILGGEFNNTTTSAYGKKVDMQLRVEDEIELNNSEFKRCLTNEQRLELQFRKNLLINHSMMLWLEEKLEWNWDGFPLQAMDVHGKTTMLLFSYRKLSTI